MATTLLLVALLGAPARFQRGDANLSVRVTFSTVATSAQEAVDALANASGAPLKASQTVRPSILLLRFNDVPLPEAMKRIAEACGGSWIADSGAYYLTRTDADERKVAARRAAELRAITKGALAEFVAAARAQKRFSAIEADALAHRLEANVEHHGNTTSFKIGNPKDFRAAQYGPGLDRLSTQIFARLKPALVDGAPSGRRTVYSTIPTRMELPLNLDLADLIPGYIEDQSQWSKTLDQFPAEDRAVLNLTGETVTTIAPTKINLVVDKSGGDGVDVQLGVELIGEDGAIISKVPARELRASQPAATNQPKPTEEAPLTLSDVDARYGTLFHRVARGRNVVPISADIRELALHPDKHEPLGMFVSDLLLRAAEAKGLNVAADLPDDYLARAELFLRTNSATQLLSELSSAQACPIRVDGQWLVIGNGSHLPHDAYVRRTDRAELAQLFAASGDTPTIEALARYALEVRPANLDPLYDALTDAVFGRRQATVGVWPTLELLGALMEQHVGSIPADNISFSSLDATGLAILNAMVFDGDSRFGSFLQGQSTEMNGRPSMLEPRDALPGGLPPDGYLTVRTTSEDAVFPSGVLSQAVRPFQIAMNTHDAATGNGLGSGPFSYTTSDKFRTGRQRNVMLVLHFTNALASTHPLSETHLTPGDPTPYSQLPEAFRKQVDRALTQLQRKR